MRVVESKKVEDCLDGSMIKDFSMDEPVDQSFIRHLGNDGSLEYFPDFARPFYRVTKDGLYVLKGVEGNKTFQVVFVTDDEELEHQLREHIEAFHDTKQKEEN
jgi:hypothetical protein